MIDAGDLSERLELLELKETQPDTWEWVSSGRLWAQIAVDGGKNLFSSVGIGTRNTKLVLRTRPLNLHQALRWKEQHLFLTGITKLDRMHLAVSAALVETVACKAQRSRSAVDPDRNNRPVSTQLPELSFPGVLTEKYVRYNRVLALLLTIPGVENFSALTINGGTEDLIIPAGSIPVVEEVSVT